MSKIASIALSIFLLSCCVRGAAGRKRPMARPHRVVRVHTEEGRVLYRPYHQLSSEDRRKIDLGVETAYRNLLKAIAENPADNLSAIPGLEEFSCGIDIHHGAGGTISFGCEHGFYWCTVTITGDEGISGECGYDPPTPATPG